MAQSSLAFTRSWKPVLKSLGFVGLVAAAASCKVDSFYDECSGGPAQCGTICEDYCDGWSCRPYCYDSCWSSCSDTTPPNPGTGATTGGTSTDGGKPRYDAGTGTSSILCSTCSTHADCGTGNKCLALGGASGSGFCGVACGSDGSCAKGYECLGVDNTKQCVPITRSCDQAKPPVPECSADRACLSGSTCVGGKCALNCTATAACATGEVCFNKSYCAPYAGNGCIDDTMCEAAQRCVGGSPTTKGTCTPICIGAQDCPKNWACGDDGICAAPAPADAGTDGG